MTDERSDKTVTTALDQGEGEVKGKERAEEQESAEENESTTAPAEDSTASTSPTPWQAIFSPQYNAYYFFNTETQQTTWENPLLPSPSPSTSTSSAPDTPQPEEPADVSSTTTTTTTSTYTSTYTALQAAALQAGIDPSLAHLDPTLLSSSLPTTSSSSTAFTAKFNARTGAFARPDARDPTHLSEHARATRMSEFYFDVGAWEKQLAEQGGSIKGGSGAGAEEEEGRKRKRPSKKDLERFKEQKKQKKIAKTAWLRT